MRARTGWRRYRRRSRRRAKSSQIFRHHRRPAISHGALACLSDDQLGLPRELRRELRTDVERLAFPLREIFHTRGDDEGFCHICHLKAFSIKSLPQTIKNGKDSSPLWPHFLSKNTMTGFPT